MRYIFLLFLFIIGCQSNQLSINSRVAVSKEKELKHWSKTLGLDIQEIQKMRIFIKKNQLEKIKKMLDGGFNINQAIYRFNRTAIYGAIENNNLELVKLFIKYGADLNYEDTQDLYLSTPLTYAQSLEKSPQKIINYLLNQKLDLIKNGDCICWGAGNNQISVVEKSLNIGIDINYKSKTEGETALLWAVSQNHIEMVKFLLSKGADIHALNRYGTNIIEMAEYEKHYKLLSYLKSRYPKLKKIEVKVFVDTPKLTNKEMENFKNQKEITVKERKEILVRVNSLTERFLLLRQSKHKVHRVLAKLVRQAILLASVNEINFSKKLLINALKIVNVKLKNNKKALLNIYSNLGSAYIMSAEYAKGITFTKKAIKLLEEIEKPRLLGASYHYLGFAYRGLGDYSLALEYYHKSLEISESNRYMKRGKESTHRALADLYVAKGEYENAIKENQKILETVKNPSLNYSTYLTMSFSYIKLKKYKEALKYANLTFNIAKEKWGKDSINMRNSYSLFGMIYTDLKEYDKALQHMKRALKLTEKKEGIPLALAKQYQMLSQLYYQQKKYKEAYDFIDKGYEIFKKDMKYHFLELNQFHKKSILFKEKSFFSTLLKNSYSIKGKEKETFNRWLNYKRSIFNIENNFKFLYLQTKDKQIKLKIDTLFKSQRRLANFYQSSIENLNSSKKIVQLQEQISELEVFLSAYSKDLKNQEITIDSIITHLKKDELYIDFAKTKKSYYLFSLNKNKKIEFQKINRKAIDTVINSIQTENQNIIDGKTFANIKKAKEQYGKLYDLIFNKIDIDNQKSLIISPDGLLSLIPFEAFYDKKEKKYLIEKVKINYIPSGKELVNLYKKEEVLNSKVVVFANPDFGVNSPKEIDKFRRGTVEALYEQAKGQNSINQLFKSLHGTQKEALAIKKLYPNSKIYRDKEASETNFFKIYQPKILHLSTHGFFLKDEKVINPMLKSGIALSGANYAIKNQNGEGIVTALEISGLNLKGTELVVLSACETGVGEVEEAEGVAGINKAFMKAGARYIVMSLWSVSDNATATLMKNFYGNIKNNKGYTIALRDAKIEMIKNGKAHPYYWSGFVGSGVD